MGSFDGAEVCDLIGLFMLSQLKHLKVNLGKYRDDALGVTCLTPRQADLVKKDICRIYKQNGFSITIEVNIKVVNFLDITMDLRTGLYKPFMKPNDCPTYINKDSNHPQSITRNIPEAVNRRLCSISANEDVFNDATPPYQAALEKSGYSYKLNYVPPSRSNSKRCRSRNITWFNPPFSANVSTNIGAKFLRTIDKCFPPSHPLSKIVNRNTVKISYRCMPNMSQNLSKHNSKISNPPDQEPPPPCNCRGGLAVCPVDGACQTKSVVYQATVEREDDNTFETYTGLTSRQFKDRYYEHTADMADMDRKGTSLNIYIWKLKFSAIPYTPPWTILNRCHSFNPQHKLLIYALKKNT